MYKLVIFDLDETLAPTGYGISPENLEILKKNKQQDAGCGCVR